MRLNPEQLGQLRQIVATLGTLLQEKGVPKPYPGIYMDITRLTGRFALRRYPPGRFRRRGELSGKPDPRREQRQAARQSLRVKHA